MCRRSTKENKIHTVIGGLHLKNSDDDFINKIIEQLKQYNIKELHACHCTGNIAIEKIKSQLPQIDIGCGFYVMY
ncbi:hypothetical protein ACFL0U_02775 [Pseudomonadota bacterium]